MPPKRSTRKAAAPSAPDPLEGCCITSSGTFPGYSQTRLLEVASQLGANTAKSLTKDATHLVTTQNDFDKPSAKVNDAQSRGLFIVNIQWLLDSEESNSKADEAQYTFGSASHSSPVAPAASQAKGSQKRQASPGLDADSTDQPDAKKKKKASADVPSKEANFGEGQIAKSRDIQIPLDEGCTLAGYGVYIDSDGVIWDAALNQTNAGNNNNKFYRCQLLVNGASHYQTWTRWGRVGERGQSRILGNGSLDDAKRNFETKFKDKSGLTWDNRTDTPKTKKYVFLERSYQSDDEDEDEKPSSSTGSKDPDRKPPTCTLEKPIQQLMELIFNQQYFAANMSDLNYDAKKMPLGKLSKATIMKGFESLKRLSALIDSPAGNYDGIEAESNLFYSTIPHAFGRNRPPVIQNQDMVKKEIEVLENLADMKDAAAIMKDDLASKETIHPLDRQFQGLGMQEMTPLDPKGAEFTGLAEYLMETRGYTHNANYNIDAIFRIERQGEYDRFGKSVFAGQPRDRRLLWHGSRTTNFGGILSQGLRIAPPEAPVSGYMFGKGIYLADMSSKSANYCCSYISGGTALLLLCEAELGDPMQQLTGASSNAGETAKAQGMWSTWGKGNTAPKGWKDAGSVHPSLAGVRMPDTKDAPGPTNEPGAYLQYNEYICYDVAQVRLRYLFRVNM